jgi:signal peptidase I
VTLRTVRRVVGRIGTALTMVVAVAVIGGVVLAAIGFGLGYRPVVITTGSMSPSAPQGSLIVARPTERVRVGDVLVMRRDGRATVSHRVVELQHAPGGAGYAVTRGDANPQNDAVPYPLGDEELVAQWVLPGAGRVVLGTGTPVVGVTITTLGCLVAMITLLRKIWQPRPSGPVTGVDGDPDAGSDGPDGPAGVGAGVVDDRLPSRRGSLPRRIVTGVLTVAVAGTFGMAWALFVSVDTVVGNVFTTAECVDARLEGVQHGQTAVAGPGTTTATIDAVDPAKAFVLYGVRGAGADPVDTVVAGVLDDATTVRFETAGPSAVVVEWSVVEYGCGVAVQRGETAGDGTGSVDVSITEVASASSFVTAAVLPASAAEPGADLLATVQLADDRTVRFDVDSPGVLAPTTKLVWQVVTFTAPGDAGSQTVTATLAAGDTTAEVALDAPVDPATTMVLVSVRSASGGPELGERLVRAQLVDPFTVGVTRSLDTESLTVVVQAVELRDGSLVRSGTVQMAPTVTTATASFPPVDADRSTGSTTVLTAGMAAGGATDASGAGAALGEAAATVVLTGPGTVRVERASSVSTASFGWQVVTWGGPSWADQDSPFRQRIDVTAGTVTAPDGYTTSLVVDHAALVELGMSLASGDDLRVWRHDGATWTELDRVLDEDSAWNDTTTTVWFRTRESIEAQATVSYWLYYGNPSPLAPLEDPAGVWLLDEGFEAGTLGAFTDRTAGTGWYAADPWTRRMALTVQGTAVTGPLTDAVVLVRVADADLGAHAQADGSDFRFTAADGATGLAHQIEQWDPATGTLAAWVRIPALPAATDTTLYLFYGAADAPDQQRPRAVWSADVAVWHLDRDPAGPAPTLDDLGPDGHDGLGLGTPARVATGSGWAADLEAGDRFEAAPLRLPGGPLSVGTWFRLDTVAADLVLVAQGDPVTTGVLELGVTVAPGSPTGLFRARIGGSLVTVQGGTVTAGVWHHLAAVCSGPACTLWLDGVSVGTSASSGSMATTELPFVLGAAPNGTRGMDGQLGEVRVSPRAWSAAEIGFAEDDLRNPGATVVASPATAGSWFGQGTWSSRRALTVDPSKVTGTLNDFPVLVELTLPGAAGSTQADGDDLVFTAADGTTRLDHVLEAWDRTTGELVAWVRLPAVSASAPTNFYLYLGNPTAEDRSDAAGVFGPDADLVVTGNR